MRLPVFSLLAFLGLAAGSAHAESGDASDQFLNAYLTFQKGERAETSGNLRGALSAYNQAVNTLDNINARWPNWNPAIIRHRREKAIEAVARLKERTMPAPERAPARPTPPIHQDPPMPSGGEASLIPDSFPTAAPEPAPIATPQPAKATPTASRKANGDPIRDIQIRIEDLQSNLNATRDRLDKVAQEKADLAKKYEVAVKEAQASEKKLEGVQRRADLAESKLTDAEKSGTKTSEELETIRKEAAAARKAFRQMQIERDAELELNEQFASRLKASQTQIGNLTVERNSAKKESAEVPKKIAEMQKQIDSVLKEKGDLESKLGKVQEQLSKVTAERDGAVQEVAKVKEASKNLDKLMAENASLLTKLTNAEKQIAALRTEGAEKDKRIAQLNQDLTGTKTQLADVQKQSAEYQVQMTQLRSKLEAQSTDLSQSVADRKKSNEENELLRGIVLRQQKEQARRDRVKKLVLEQLAKLEVNSKAVKDQVNLLGSPIVKLTEKERRLFKEPQLTISDTDITFAAPDTTKAAPAEPETPTAEAPAATLETAAATPAPTATPASAPTPIAEKVASAANAAEATPAVKPEVPAEGAGSKPDVFPIPDGTPGNPGTELVSAKLAIDNLPNLDPDKKDSAEGDLPSRKTAAPGSSIAKSSKSSATPGVPKELVGLARQAKEHFERGSYRDAEKIYLKAAAQAPNNLYVLSNLGVTQFRQQKYKQAEETFHKAIANAPEDDFSHCTLGIVYYQKNELDSAIQSLTRALAINPKNATAHNYLGITASQKGWQEAAQKELETAVALDPNYADAHFNLAVVFATQNPPNRDEARKHYKRATELGAEPDQELEKMVKQ